MSTTGFMTKSFFSRMLEDPVEGLQVILEEGPWAFFQPDQIDYHDEIYEIVTGALCLDKQLCLDKGLRLMICDSRNGPVIGISRKRYPALAPDPTSLEQDTGSPPKTLTIWAAGELEDVWACYEADLEDGETSPPTYRVSGAWVCSSNIPSELIGARCDVEGEDAILL